VGFISPVFPYPRSGVYVGIERHALELVRHLRRAGCSVTVFTTFWNGGEDGDVFEGLVIRRARDLSSVLGRLAAVFDLHYVSWGRNLLDFKDRLRDCDVLHALGPLSTAKTFTSAGLPLVTHFHHYEAIRRPRELLHKPFHHRIERRAYRHSTLVAALSRHSGEDLRVAFGIPWEQIRIIPDGVDLSRFTPGPKPATEEPVVLCVGAHEPRKGFEYLLRAVRLLTDGGVRCRVVCVGEGPETATLKVLARNLGIDPRTDFVGYVSPDSEELPRLYQDAAVFVHPSLEEGFGMVLVEAMASGIPVVASHAGAIPEVVGDAGLLVPPRDPRALADAIERVLSDASLRESLARRGRARAEALFSWESVAKKTIEVYEEAIDLAGRAS